RGQPEPLAQLPRGTRDGRPESRPHVSAARGRDCRTRDGPRVTAARRRGAILDLAGVAAIHTSAAARLPVSGRSPHPLPDNPEKQRTGRALLIPEGIHLL